MTVLRIRLTPFTPDDAAAVFEGRRTAEWAAGYPTDGDLEMAARLHTGAKRYVTDEYPWSVWSVILCDNGTVIGGAGFHDEPDAEGAVEIGYGIAEEFRGRGVATTAVELLLGIARAAGAHRVVAGTDADNTASQRVLQKAGFSRTDDEDGEWRWARDLTD